MEFIFFVQENSSDTESDDDDDNDDDEEEDSKPEFESVSLKHFGGVNRIRVNKYENKKKQNISKFYLFFISQQLLMIVKQLQHGLILEKYIFGI